jgi:hypothetical protein
MHRQGSGQLLRRVTLAVFATATMVAGPLTLVATTTASASTPTPVLGSKAFEPIPDSLGWGTVRPKKIYNGGDPSGSVQSLTWKGWGSKTAYGRGKGFIFKPDGGYYPTVGVELRASGLGHCGSSSHLAYTHLAIRAPSKPGAALGPWTGWSGSGAIC